MSREYKYKSKSCKVCGVEFIPKGQNSIYCSVMCKKKMYKESGKSKAWRDTFNIKQGVTVGIGSGGHTKQGAGNHMYIHGKSTFDRWARERKQTLGTCERCGTDLSNLGQWGWAGHHKDHNQLNNVIENLELLCSKCHLIEHERWTHFESVTTIPKGSREKSPEAQSTSTGDEIVCST